MLGAVYSASANIAAELLLMPVVLYKTVNTNALLAFAVVLDHAGVSLGMKSSLGVPYVDMQQASCWSYLC
jgi:hypothetical protein